MNVKFIPRSPTFWLYHSLGLLGLASVDLATSFLAPHLMAFKLWAAFLLWPIFFTTATLGFRWLYNRYSIFHEGVGKLVPLVVAYATAAAFLSALATTATLLPFFWQDFVPPQQLATGDVNLAGIAGPLVLSVTLSGQLFISVWAFIYVFVKERRRAKASELHNLRLQNSLKEAQLASLANQLNPHFLFNSLNNIRFAVHENPLHADHMITALSEILRYSLESSAREVVELAEELAMTQRFIDIVKLQYEDKLEYRAEVPSPMYHFRIPPMSLQLLVENAVKHGIEQIRDGGTITVTAATEATGYSLTVISPVPDSPAHTAPATGTGLANIRNRLQLLYGHRANLAIQQTEGEFRAVITLPAESI